MILGEHGVREHLHLLAPAFALVTAVWLLRLIVAAADSPAWLIRLVSVTVATTVAVLLSVILIHARAYGGYLSVVVASLLINVWAQFLIILSILFSILTGTNNIYTAPEFSFGANQWRHIHGHLTLSIGVGTLVAAAEGCLLLWLLRMLVPMGRDHGQNTVQGIRP
ncbi:MAG TPA: hypothetical protein VE398_16210 [Acidobacteriota bacterium]|nr:hypothetical protein [Acidobacteriota bacterium]